MWLVLAGHLAWQTHLGGFIAGARAAIWLDR
jgi:membrane associated rhomboid family serine protease